MDKLQNLRLSELRALTDVPPQYIKPLAAVGGLWTSYQLYRLSSFAWYHFLRPSGLSKYKKGGKGEPWALVTGASDGIGEGFAEELAQQGFNVVLHGRNEQKLLGVKERLQAQWPTIKFRILVLDAINDVSDSAKIEAAVNELATLNIKVLINNVGGVAGGKPTMRKFTEQSPDMIDGWIDVNARFPVQITRQVLPQLIANQPALIINIGSGASEVPSPWMSIYSGTKAFNLSWSRSLAVELQDEGHDIDCHAIIVGQVSTARMGSPTSVTSPSPRKFARSALGVAGTGQKIAAAYWGHDMLMSFFKAMPSSFAENFVRKISRQLAAKEMKELEEEAKQR